jgi:hypothetical protein
MGTQQLLLIVLGVIIVGVAIAVGITIFNNQAYNANQQAVAQELTTYGTMVLQWWKTPEVQGGKGKKALVAGDDVKIRKWCGFPVATTALETESGKYAITAVTVADTTVTIIGVGDEKKTGPLYPRVTATVKLPTSKITSVIGTNDTDSPIAATP